MRLIIAIIVSLFLFNANVVNGCTIFMLEKDEVLLVGNNEDYSFPFTAVWFIPPSGKKYGRVCFGFEVDLGRQAATGGMNDQGLFIDGNGLGNINWTSDETKKTHKSIVEEYVLAHFSSVEETISWFRNTNIPILKRAKFLVVDKSGESAVIEWGNGKLQVIRRKGNYQISTNFRQSVLPDENYSDYRFNLVKGIIERAKEYDVKLVRRALSASHWEAARTMTLFSNIYDLKDGIVYVYNFHNFEHVIKFKLEDELKKGKKVYYIPKLFPFIPYSQHLFVPGELGRQIGRSFEKKGLEGVKRNLRKVKELSLAVYNRDYSKSILNSLGYDFLGKKRFPDAINIFRLNISLHPEYTNGYDSLGEAYMKTGDKISAIKAYEKALELDPNMNSAKNALKILKK